MIRSLHLSSAQIPLAFTFGIRALMLESLLYLDRCMQFSRYDIPNFFKAGWHPPILPRRLQRSTFGRSALNRRVRDGNGCYLRRIDATHWFLRSRTALRIQPHDLSCIVCTCSLMSLNPSVHQLSILHELPSRAWCFYLILSSGLLSSGLPLFFRIRNSTHNSLLVL